MAVSVGNYADVMGIIIRYDGRWLTAEEGRAFLTLYRRCLEQTALSIP
jgi:hypothetical protein